MEAEVDLAAAAAAADPMMILEERRREGGDQHHGRIGRRIRGRIDHGLTKRRSWFVACLCGFVWILEHIFFFPPIFATFSPFQS